MGLGMWSVFLWGEFLWFYACMHGILENCMRGVFSEEEFGRVVKLDVHLTGAGWTMGIL